MVFDDDPTILEICQILLEAKGYIVQIKTNCNTLFDDLRSFNPHLILIDDWIREPGGIKAIMNIKNHRDFATTPVILFSSSSRIELLATSSGADGYLEKPFDIHHFKELVERTLLLSKV